MKVDSNIFEAGKAYIYAYALSLRANCCEDAAVGLGGASKDFYTWMPNF